MNHSPARARSTVQLLATTRGIIGDMVGWRRIGFALNIVVVTIALAVLLNLLGNIELHKVVVAIKAMPVQAIALSGMFVAAGYLSLTLYDYFALRTIGRPEVPYWTAAFAGFASYAVGHNVGATVLTGGAVRLHIYSAWAIGVIDVAKIAFITGLTFWLGNTFVLGLALAYAPDAAAAVTQLPPWANQALGAIALMVIAGYVAWLLPRPRVIGRGGWQITLPGASMTLVQIGIGFLDLAAGALAFYVLLPREPAVDFMAVTVTFFVATLLGFISHAPGSLGIFDAAMIMALPQFEVEQLLASLLIFRCLYFILPFVLAVLMLGLRVLIRSASRAAA